jgi:hypothetical protein
MPGGVGNLLQIDKFGVFVRERHRASRWLPFFFYVVPALQRRDLRGAMMSPSRILVALRRGGSASWEDHMVHEWTLVRQGLRVPQEGVL